MNCTEKTTNSLNLLSEESLDELIQKANLLFKNGRCCPIECGAKSQRFCGAVEEGIKVASFAVHDGEEPPISGWNGAGNIFFSGCSAKCIFCQNWPISHKNNGKVYSINDFAKNIIDLLHKKVHNINLVTSDHYLGKVLQAFKKIRNQLQVPIVYNCNGAQAPELFKVVLQVTDIFLFDIKYATNELSRELCAIKNYVDINQNDLNMLLEKQIEWVENDLGILQKGLIIRHLVLPNFLDNSIEVINLLNKYKERGLNFKLSLMSQYFPAYEACNNPKLNVKVSKKEYGKVIDLVDKYNMDGWIQDF